MLRNSIILTLLIFVFCPAYSQRGGESVYSFLQLTNSARVAALGGDNVSIHDDDINLVFHNPALLSPDMDQHFNLNYVNYFAGMNYGYTSYAFKKEGIGTFAGGIHYVDYGTFEGTDENGNFTGSFRASEYAINLVYSRPLIDSVLFAGVNLKPIFSIYEQYTSLGITSDWGLFYVLRKTNSSFGLVLKNFGTQITSFSGSRESVPFEIQAGFTQALEHAPFRFSILLQHLERWDLSYELPETESLIFGGTTENESPFDAVADNFMRHLVLGAEILMGQNFHFDLGYNYKRRHEMKMERWPGMVGFSWGFGFKVKKFHVAYGRARFHAAAATNHFSITTNLSEF